ncbi:MAG: ABC transporter substrate-binding protein [Acidimicrobiales bacterium]
MTYIHKNKGSCSRRTGPPRAAALFSDVWRRARIVAIASLMIVGVVQVLPSASSAATHHAPTNQTFVFGRQGSLLTRSYNPFNPNWVQYLSNTALMQLAFDKPFSLTGYYPELAKSIIVKGHDVVVTLQNDKWTNSKPVTSTDVLDAFLIEGAGGGNNIWINLTNVTTPNAHEIVFALSPKEPPDQLLASIDTIIPVPASTYGHLLPKNLKSALLTNYAIYSRVSAKAASASASGKEIAAVDKKVVAFSPSTFLSDGPYRMTAVNTSEIRMRKWNGFWDSSKFTIKYVEFHVLGSNNAVYPAMLNGQFDETLVGMPRLIVQQATKTPHLTLFSNGDGTTVKGLFFNERQYPFSIPGVRQAIAEMINRPAMVSDVWGTFPHGAGGADVMKYPMPISPTIAAGYLTTKQLATLNTYSYNVAKATSTLKGLGFTKGGSGWIMPNGKPFTATIEAPSGWSGPDLASEYLSTLFTSLGIQTQVVEPQYAQFYSDLTGGTFDLIYFWTSCCEITNPMNELTLPLSDYNSSVTQPGIGIGPVVNVPGLGSVNVAQAITKDSATLFPGTPSFDRVLYDWVHWFNATLPVLDIANQRAFSVYDNSRFIDWPPFGSPVLSTYTQGSQGQEILAMQEGYIHSR